MNDLLTILWFWLCLEEMGLDEEGGIEEAGILMLICGEKQRHSKRVCPLENRDNVTRDYFGCTTFVIFVQKILQFFNELIEKLRTEYTYNIYSKCVQMDFSNEMVISVS